VETLSASLEDENAFVRIEAARALGRIEDPKALEPLKSRLGKESDSIARNAIEQALKKLEV
jgi:HEAT repeat protein